MAEGDLRVGIIGGGAIVRQRHLPGLRALEGVEIAAVCNRRYESTRAFADEYAIPRACFHWREVVEAGDIDIIWIGTTPYMHCELILAALEAGKHVFCQSRMCMNLDEARRILEAAGRHPDRVVRFCPPPMGMGGDATMRRLLRRERFVGDVRQVTLTSVNGLLLDPDYPLTWRLQREQSGQNVMTLGIYLEVLDRWLGPTSRVTAVTRCWTPTRRHPETGEQAPCEIPELVNVIAELACGGIGVYLFNGVSSHGPTDHVAIHGTGGTLVYDFNADENLEQIEGARLGQESMARIEIPPAEKGTWTVEADFIRLVRGEGDGGILPTPEAACRYMAVIDAIHRSAATGRCVEVPER